jgi:aminoglycoside phosphotransferase
VSNTLSKCHRSIPSRASGLVQIANALFEDAQRSKRTSARYALTVIAMTRTPILIGESGASVIRLTQEDGASWIEKSGSPARIEKEAAALRWCEGRLPVAQVLDHRPGLLEMSELPGCPVSNLSIDIACAVLADALRQIHAVSVAGCPLLSEWSLRLQEAEERVRLGLVDESDFDDENLGRSSESILAELRSLSPMPKRRCFTHGDATLENFLAADGKLSGIVDMGRSGIAHPAQDWALTLRSMRHHFGPEGERRLRGHLPPDCSRASLLHRFCLLDELF